MPQSPHPISFGCEGLDEIVSGGLPGRHLHLLEGGPGTGKTTLAPQFLRAGLERGEMVSVFLFEERRKTFFRRCEGLDLDMRRHEKIGLLALYDVTPTEISPGEFAHLLQRDVDERRMTVHELDISERGVEIGNASTA